MEVLKKESIDEASELFSYYNITNPKKCLSIIKRNKSLIIGVLKRKTNSLSIKEKGKKIYIEYLLDKDADKANEFSVYRIQTVFGLLPIYDTYCTKAIILPYPNEEIYKIVLQNSIKAMPKANIVDVFDVHINQIWNNVILDKYSSSSGYEWQNQYVRIREESLNFAKTSIRYFESLMEGNQARFKSSLTRLLAQQRSLSDLLSKTKRYNRQSKKYFDKGQFSEQEKTIGTWCSSLNNTLNQLGNIVRPKEEHDRNVAFGNLKAVFYKLTPMQQSFDSVVGSSFKYFNLSTLKKEEQIWYDRLHITVSYYISCFINSSRNKIFNSKTTIRNWWDLRNNRKLKEVHEIINDFDDQSHFSFHLPNRILETETLSQVVIGVIGLTPENFEEESLNLVYGLVDLASTKINFFNFVGVEDSQAFNIGFVIQKTFFERFRTFLETGEFEESDFGNPHPINVDETLLESLNGITLKKIEMNKGAESFTQMMFDIWKLSEYRSRLSKKNTIEKEWLEEVEKEYGESIQKFINEVDVTDEFRNDIKKFIKSPAIMNKDEVVNHLNDYLVSMS